MSVTGHGLGTKVTKVTKITKSFVVFVVFVTFVMSRRLVSLIGECNQRINP